MKRRTFFQALGLARFTPPACSTRFYSSFKHAIWRDKRVLEGPYYVQLVGPGYEFDINHTTTADIMDRILGPKSLDVSVVELGESIAVKVENGLVFPFPPFYDGLVKNAILSKPSGDLAMCVAINHYMVSAGRERNDTMILAWANPLVLLS